VTGAPITVEPSRIVNATDPSFTVPAGLVTVALSATDWASVLNTTDAAEVATVAAAGVIVTVWLASAEPVKFAVPL
jgi:hypothetical protein